MSKVRDLVGFQSGRLTVVERAGSSPTTGAAMWRCSCECGGEVVVVRNNLCSGHTKSCGCLTEEVWLTARTSHNLSKTPEYRVWKGLRTRIHNSETPAYASYGGRGLTIDPRWDSSFELFLADMGCRPGPEYSIDRIDNNQGYWPDNCKWATKKEQANNRRTSRTIGYEGVSKTLAQWAETLGISYGALQARLDKGWSVEKAFETPVVPGQKTQQTAHVRST